VLADPGGGPNDERLDVADAEPPQAAPVNRRERERRASRPPERFVRTTQQSVGIVVWPLEDGRESEDRRLACLRAVAKAVGDRDERAACLLFDSVNVAAGGLAGKRSARDCPVERWAARRARER
jgi:hypothetical protein